MRSFSRIVIVTAAIFVSVQTTFLFLKHWAPKFQEDLAPPTQTKPSKSSPKPLSQPVQNMAIKTPPQDAHHNLLKVHRDLIGRIGYAYRQFPPCSGPQKGFQASTDLEHTLWHIDKTEVLKEPFSHAFYCDIFPPSLYEELVRTFPVEVFEDELKNPYDINGQPRLVLSLKDIVRGKVSVDAATKEPWTRLASILHDRRFTDVLFKKFGLEDKIGKYKGPATRLLVHDEGFKLNIHPDASNKYLTMMLYFAPVSEFHETLFEYGTNVHTVSQFKKGDVDDWQLRYMFLPNSAYVMKISDKSYHSVSSLPAGPSRRTLVLNWWISDTEAHEDQHSDDAPSKDVSQHYVKRGKGKSAKMQHQEGNKQEYQLKSGFLLSHKGLSGETLDFDYEQVKKDLTHLRQLEGSPRATTNVLKWPFPTSKDRGYCISVGATSGKDDPLWPLLKQGYKGLFLEAQEKTYKNLERNVAAYDGVIASNVPITPLNVGHLLDQYEVPDDVDWLKMNIDSCDCPLTEELVKSRKIHMVVMETNHNIPPPIIWGLNYSPDTRFCVQPHAYYGCSLMYQVEMLKKYGYELLSYQGGDALFGLPHMVSFFNKSSYAVHPLAHFLHDDRSRKCAVDAKGCHNTADTTVMQRMYKKIITGDLEGAVDIANIFFSTGKEFCEHSQDQGFQNYEISKEVKKNMR